MSITPTYSKMMSITPTYNKIMSITPTYSTELYMKANIKSR